MNAAGSSVVERKGERLNMEIAVFIGELLGAETEIRVKQLHGFSHI
jgi:hypothetical protein